MTTETALTDDMSLIEQLRGYAANNGYSHNDYADTMTAAADALESHQHAVLQSPEVQAWKRDAERYQFLKENIQPDYDLPGSYYLPDDDTETWDRTIDAAMEQQT